MGMTKEDLQSKIADLEKEKATLNPSSADDRWRLNVIEQQLFDLNSQLADLDRTEKQQDFIRNFKLPKDYSTIFGDPRANAEITSLMNQLADQMMAMNNSDMADKQTQIVDLQGQIRDLNDKLTTANQSVTELQADAMSKDEEITNLNAKVAELSKANDQLTRDNKQLQLDKEHAESKRDAAVKDAEQLRNDVNELEGMVRSLKMRTSSKPLEFTFTSTLESAPENSKVPSAMDIVMKKVGLGDLKKPEPPEVKQPEPTFPDQAGTGGNTIPDESANAAGTADQQQEDVTSSPFQQASISSVSEGQHVDPGASSQNGNVAGQKTLEERVTALEAWRNEVEAAQSVQKAG